MEQELITAEDYAAQEDEQDTERQRLEEYHERMMQMGSELNRPGVPHIKGLNRQRVMQNFMDSFELIGGVPRLAMWANEHPGEFYRLYSKLMPSQSINIMNNTQNVIKHVLPPSKLDE